MSKVLGTVVFLGGLAGLGYWGYRDHAADMQEKVTANANAAIGDAIHDISIEVSGRDIHLTGLADGEEEAERLIAAAQAVEGRRVVTSDLEVLSFASPYLTSATKDADGSYTASGTVPSSGLRDQIVEGTGIAVLADLDVASGAPDGYAAAAGVGLDTLTMLEEGSFSLEDTTLTLTGIAADAETYDAVVESLTSIGDGFTITQDIGFTPTASPFVMSVNKDTDGGLTVVGVSPDDEARTQLIEGAGSEAFEELSIAQGAPEGWNDAALAGVSVIDQLLFGQMSMTDTTLRISGEAPDEATFESTSSALADIAGFDVTNEISFTPPVPEVATDMYLRFDQTRGLFVGGTAPADLDTTAISELFGASSVVGSLTNDGTGAADPVLAAAEAVQPFLPDFDFVQINAEGESASIIGRLMSDADLDGTTAAITDTGLFSSVDLTLAAPQFENGDTRDNPETGVAEEYADGVWLPVAEEEAEAEVEPEAEAEVEPEAEPVPEVATDMYLRFDQARGLFVGGTAPADLDTTAVSELFGAPTVVGGLTNDGTGAPDSVLAAAEAVQPFLPEFEFVQINAEGESASIIGRLMSDADLDGTTAAITDTGAFSSVALTLAEPQFEDGATRDNPETGEPEEYIGGIWLPVIEEEAEPEAEPEVEAEIEPEAEAEVEPEAEPVPEVATDMYLRFDQARGLFVGGTAPAELSATALSDLFGASTVVGSLTNDGTGAPDSVLAAAEAVQPFLPAFEFVQINAEGESASIIGRLMSDADLDGTTAAITDTGVFSSVELTLAEPQFEDGATRDNPETGEPEEYIGGIWLPVIEEEAEPEVEAEVEPEAEAEPVDELTLAVCGEQTQAILEEQSVNFVTGSAELDVSSLGVIEQLVSVVQECFAQNPTLSIEIQGHTDSVGDADFNRLLSEQRATAVRAELIAQGLEEEERLTARGLGEDAPIADNATPEGRATNRRTVVVWEE